MSERLEESRERFEQRLAELRAAAEEELGWSPRGWRWMVPLVGVAAGLVLGMTLRRNLPAAGSRRRRLSR